MERERQFKFGNSLADFNGWLFFAHCATPCTFTLAQESTAACYKISGKKEEKNIMFNARAVQRVAAVSSPSSYTTSRALTWFTRTVSMMRGPNGTLDPS